MTPKKNNALRGKKGLWRKNKSAPARLRWKQNSPENGEGGGFVVKGVSKRVIVVKAPDPRIFEQAIFIVREDYAGEAGVSDREVLRQARQAVESYMGSASAVSWTQRLRAPIYAAAGAAATGLAWLAVQMAHL